MKKNIVLIGFMGTGKTTVGKRLAERLGLKFVDTDAVIEEVTGKSIAQIFKQDGPIRFRSEEKLLARKLSDQEGLVIATGGGMVLDPENVELLSRKGILIRLTADREVLWSRLKGKKNRPLLNTGKGDLRETIDRLLEEREPAYRVAEFTVDTGRDELNEVVEKIIDYLRERNFYHEKDQS